MYKIFPYVLSKYIVTSNIKDMSGYFIWMNELEG